MAPKPKPRYYEPASVENGDLIRVVWTDRGIEHTRTARVYRRIDDGDVRAFFTEEGGEICHWIPGDKRNVRVVMLEPALREQTDMLSLFEDVLKDAS